MNILPAHPEDAPRLKMLTLAAKKHWGYSQEWMTVWANAVYITPRYVSENHIFAAFDQNKMVGWYGLEDHGETVELAHLWVTPERIGTGIGTELWRHALRVGKSLGAKRLELEADKHAEGFYIHMGARRIRTVETVIEGTLPILAIDLEATGESEKR